MGGESMSDLIGGLLGRPGYSDTARSPPAKSPSGSKVSSRRESFMFFMGMSTDSGKSRTELCKLRFENRAFLTEHNFVYIFSSSVI